MCYCVKEIKTNPLMLFLSIQNPGKNEPSPRGRQIFSGDRAVALGGGYLRHVPVPRSTRGRPRVCTKSKDLGEPALKTLPEDLYLANFSFGLRSLASVRHVRSTRMVGCRLIAVEWWFTLVYF